MSLRAKLLLSIVAGVLLTFVLGGALVHNHATRKVETEMRSALAVGARIVTNAVDDFEQFADPHRRLALLVADFDGDRHLRAEVSSPRGDVILASRTADAEQPAPGWFHALFADRRATVTVPLPKVFDSIGTLRLEADPRNEIGEAWSDAMTTLSILAILVALVLGIVATLLERALRPLDRLAHAFGEIGGASATARVPEQGPIEMARVYQAFNRMVDRLSLSEVANRRLNEQLLTVQEEERADIARDLHDEIGPFLFAVDVDAAAIARIADGTSAQPVRERVKSIRDSIGHMQAHVRGILARLRPAALLDLGLAHAIDNLIASWESRHPGISFTKRIDAPPLSEASEAALYRVAQEALSNAVRHGAPEHVDVTLASDDRSITLSIVDDGRGLSPGATGYGIPGMRERLVHAGGQLKIANRSDRSGVVVTASLPLSTGAPLDAAAADATAGAVT